MPDDQPGRPFGGWNPPSEEPEPVESDSPSEAPSGDAGAYPYTFTPRAEAADAAAAGALGVPPVASRYAWEDPSERYVDVPASLELSYTAADLGLSARAYERSFPYERRRRHVTGVRMRRIGRELVETLILAALIFFAVRAVVQNFRVEGSSMEPSMSDSQYLLVNKAIYFRVDMDRIHRFLPFLPGDGDGDRHLFRAPRRGDVIVFKFPQDPSRDFIKRVIGVPGDTVEIREGIVFINGGRLEEDYILSIPPYSYGPKTVPEGQYFVLGDNRRNSYDSHQWAQSCPSTQQCDFVPEENIIGQAWLSYWPFDTLGFVNNKVLKPLAP